MENSLSAKAFILCLIIYIILLSMEYFYLSDSPIYLSEGY